MPGIWSASASISSIASPELVPGAAWPEISNAGTPWKREVLLGVVAQPVRAKAEKGDISPSVDAHIPLAEVFGLGAIGRVALNIDALDAALRR